MCYVTFANNISSPFTGPTFEIIAGSEKTRFVAHASMLDKSDKLRAIIRGKWGKWKETSECEIMLADWDAETIGRLVEWLYTGDYQCPYPAEVPQSVLEDLKIRIPETPMPSKEREKCFKPAPKGLVFPRRLAPLMDVHFTKANQGLAPSQAEAFKLWSAKSHGVLNFEATLLAHAKLYVLADYMLLPTLQAQNFYRLKAVFTFINQSSYSPDTHSTSDSLFKENMPVIENIINLAQYVYTNTTRLGTEEEPLRKLVSTFIALNYDQFRDERGVVQGFLAQGGDIQADILDKVGKYQLDLKYELTALKK